MVDPNSGGGGGGGEVVQLSSTRQQQKQRSQLNIFQRLEEAQSSHGVPVADYAQYHAYCTKKLDRLRHNRAVRALLVHNHRYVEGVSGRRHAYCPRNNTIISNNTSETAANSVPVDGDEGEKETTAAAAAAPSVPHENVFWNLFFQAERAWAQACALQQQQPKPLITSGKPKKQSNHAYVQRRLNKAAKFAREFHQAIVAFYGSAARTATKSSACDDMSNNANGARHQTVIESEAYVAWMEGNAALEHKHHAAAYRHYKQSMTVLLELAAAATVTTATAVEEETGKNSLARLLAMRDLWTTRAETVLRPLVRYCQYEARDELTAEDLMETTVSAATKKRDVISSSSIVLHFRGQDIALDAYKQIAVLYLKMEPSLKHPDSLDESQFLQLLSDLDDAIQMVATEMKQYESASPSSSTAGPSVAANKRLNLLSTVQAYFRYQKLSIWRHQQEQRVAELQNDADIVHVYDALQQNALAMAELSAATADAEEDPFCLEAQAHVVRIRALRCYYLARLYESTLGGTSGTTSKKQILALLQQSQKLSKRASEEIAACDTIGESESDSYLDALDALRVKIRAMECRVEATEYLEASSATGFSATTTERPLWMRLEEMDAGLVLADDPPLPIPMPCKGVFYDIAWKHVAAPVTSVLEDYIAAHEPKKSRFLGWFG